MIAGTRSGAGKTTVATGLMAAWSAAGMRVAPAKAGPDFIDPGYHSVAAGRPGRNLDAWICGPGAMVPLAAAAAGSATLVVEGVMGLFDGTSFEPSRAQASTAELARLLRAPVVLVVDAASISGSVAAVVHGFASLDPSLRLAGVVLNRVGSDTHAMALRRALEPLRLPVLGMLRRDTSLAWRDRHLGLVPVAEDRAQVTRSVRRLGEAVGRQLDLAGLEAVARSAPPLPSGPLAPARRVGDARVAVAGGPAFSFVYPDNLEALEQAGAELLRFDPLEDRALPAGTQALYAGGGFPEVFAERLAANRPLLAHLRRQVRDGLPVWAECGGTLWLGRSLEGREMGGCVEAEGRMSARPALGYRRCTVRRRNPVASEGSVLRGHEFHYSRMAPAGDALSMWGAGGYAAGGYATPSMLASYLHLHLGAHRDPAERFVAAATRHRPSA